MEIIDELVTGSRHLGRSLTYGLLDSLGRQIVTGKFDATVFPTEAELAKQYGVSWSVTREAVKMLTAKGTQRTTAARDGGAADGWVEPI